MAFQLFQRRASLILAPPISGSLQAPDPSKGILIEGLRVQFKVNKTITKEPNTAEIQVFNLAESTRAKLQSRGTRIILMAGYEGHEAQIFSGDSRSIDHIRDGADWITKIQSGDGERNYRFALINTSLKPGASVKDAIMACVKAMALDPGNAAKALANITQQYVSGYAMQGKASAEIDSQLAGIGLQWSIQDGRLQILAPGKTTDESAVLIDANAGIIGSPEHGSPEVVGAPPLLKFKVLLNPQVRPGRQVKMDSLNIHGPFYATKVSHSGDTFKGDWYTETEARALS